MQKSLINIGREIIDMLLKQNAYRSSDIIAGIEGERFHTVDTQNLVLLLTENSASEELLVAAMAHDIERWSVPNAGKGYTGKRVGIEYEIYKKNHAKKGAEIMAEHLRTYMITDSKIERICFLIKHHDDTDAEIQSYNDEELAVLVAADSLSWLNFSAPNYFNGKEKKGIDGLIDKMQFMLRKLPQKYWEYIPKVSLIDRRVLPYLIQQTIFIANERGFQPPYFGV